MKSIQSAKIGSQINNAALINTSSSLRTACIFTPKLEDCVGAARVRVCERGRVFAERQLFSLSIDWPCQELYKVPWRQID